MAVGILVSEIGPPVHHVLHDLESVFWVGFIDALKQSRTEKGDEWLQELYQSPDMRHIGSTKLKLLLAEFPDYFSETYSVMGQLLHDWKVRLSQLFHRNNPYELSFNYKDQNYYGEVFDDLDVLFEKFIAEERRRDSARAESSTVEQQALEQQQQHHSEDSVIDFSRPVRRESRRRKGLAPETIGALPRGM